MSKVSISDIARLAGTSSATVSRVLSGRTYVSPGIAERVREVVRKNGFVMNSSASVLARRRSPREGLVHRAIALIFCGLKPAHLADVNTLLRPDLQAGIQEAAAERDLAVSTWFLRQDQVAAGSFPAAISRNQFDGILLKPAAGQNADIFGKIAPCIILGARQQVACRFPVVEVDNDLGIDALVEHLYGLGHRHIEFLTRRGPHVPFQERAARFMVRVEQLGLKGCVVAEETESYESYAQEFIRRPVGERPTAIIGASDLRAVRAIHDLFNQQVRIPLDVSVAGFDGSDAGMAVHPPLPTWAPNWAEVGRQGVRVLFDRMVGKDVPTRTLIGGELIVRTSTASSPGAGLDPNSSPIQIEST